ncbi:PBP1A family penicillin-binding protein [Euhalothece natronophila Z-M001]|uniref:PBP1A family penicillin-binding protein n=1 Tax=Euhalothece natronophila Z-M001 TaxID=522448 RepID=A0A5B8NNR0_9CHRO|nr:PBP1A family penicillin-binding protein [Euhalothece natronophila]QDZ40704.1 PBP1A family penicillin-binding protein [Euhalothece natronophila Z-M001]
MTNRKKTAGNPVSQFVTQAVQTVQAQALTLKPTAKVPELQIKNGREKKIVKHPLIGERYLLGRSSRASDIVVRNPLISQVHLSINQDKGGNYYIKDEGSLNGIYLGKRKQSSFPLRHGDKFTLGPPELEDAVEITYQYAPPQWQKALSYFFYGTLVIALILGIFIAREWTQFSVHPLPMGVRGPVVVYPRDGQAPLNPRQRGTHQELDRLSDFSHYLPDAVIAAEDTRFYWHLGVDPLGILRAIRVNLTAADIREGASTITQQLARSLYPEYVGRENTAGRKIREMMVSLKLETFYSKDKLLLTYLNRVFLGVENYGFEDAAQFYFDKSASDLTLSEAATLVAILPAPNAYNPAQNYDRAVQLRDRVINRMAQLGMVSGEEAQRARRSRIEISPEAQQILSEIRAPYFYNHVLNELRDLLGAELAAEGNFIVETELDLNLQETAENRLQEHLNSQGTVYGYSQGSLVTLDSQTGAILALVGGKNYQESQFNRATQAERQPGSTFKVFAYAAALEQGISPSRTYSCAPITWQGQNYRGCERTGGNISLGLSLAQSENAVALRVAQDVGLNRVIRMAQRLGINSNLSAVPGLVLGQSEVNLLEITGAYTAFDHEGKLNRPHGIVKILDGADCEDANDPDTCRVIYDYENDAERDRAVISPSTAQTMTQWLQRAVQEGTGRSARMGETAAGKTGTTNRAVDLWFIGYLPNRNITTGIWLGNDVPTPTRGSSAQAAQLWGNYMGSINQ